MYDWTPVPNSSRVDSTEVLPTISGNYEYLVGIIIIFKD